MLFFFFFFFNDTATTEIYTLSLHDALPILARHAESEFSVRAAVSSDPAVQVGLTPAGDEQARGLGRSLEDERIDVCVVTEFERTRRTAEVALDGRDVEILVVPELNDPRAGRFDGGPLDEF